MKKMKTTMETRRKGRICDRSDKSDQSKQRGKQHCNVLCNFREQSVYIVLVSLVDGEKCAVVSASFHLNQLNCRSIMHGEDEKHTDA